MVNSIDEVTIIKTIKKRVLPGVLAGVVSMLQPNFVCFFFIYFNVIISLNVSRFFIYLQLANTQKALKQHRRKTFAWQKNGWTLRANAVDIRLEMFLHANE